MGMKVYNIILLAVMVCIVFLFIGMNVYINAMQDVSSRGYRVDVERAALDIAHDGEEQLNLEKYPSVIQVEKLGALEQEAFFEGGDADYLIRKIEGEYYRFDYIPDENGFRRRIIYGVNLLLGLLSAILFFVLIFMKRYLIKPFHQMRELPYELSKGNLTAPIKENKSGFFGRFLWGMDLLRENLEDQKIAGLKLQKEKKTLILSISHDIKTPLSAIKLYAKAISKNLYDSPEKQADIAESIHEKADEIETYVSQIMKASHRDFINLKVDNGEFYLSQMIEKIAAYYEEKMSLLKIDFDIERFSDCILKGDEDRAVEVLQNILENALKYGDGHKVTIEFSQEEDCRLITVCNSGCTLPGTELLHIFDSFWRGSNTGNNGGSGLGLYICRQLMNKMGGEVFAQCEDGQMKVTAVFSRA